MNKDNAKDYLPLVQALAEEKVIQGYFEIDQVWCDIVELRFDAPASQYRIKPEPREVWVNYYPRQDIGVVCYQSKDLAAKWAAEGAIQTLHREVIE